MAIPINENLEIEPIFTKHDEESKVLLLSFLYEKQIFQIINMYAPITPFLRNTGDFNMVEGLLLDRKKESPQSPIK